MLTHLNIQLYIVFKSFLFDIVIVYPIMTKKYSIEKKEKLVNKIKKLKNKEDFITIFNLIQEKEQKPIKEVGDSTMMYFHDLKSQTYEAIDNFLKDTHKNKSNKI